MENIYPNEWIFSLLPSLTKKKMSALTLAIMLLWQTPLQAKDTLAEIKISISVNDVPLKKALRKIETKTGLKFFYISSQIDTDRKVTIEAYNAPLNVVLKIYLRIPTSLTISGEIRSF